MDSKASIGRKRRFLTDIVRSMSRLYRGRTKGQQAVWNEPPADWPEGILGPWKNPTANPKDTVDLLMKKLTYLRAKVPLDRLPTFEQKCLEFYDAGDLFSLKKLQIKEKILKLDEKVHSIADSLDTKSPPQNTSPVILSIPQHGTESKYWFILPRSDTCSLASNSPIVITSPSSDVQIIRVDRSSPSSSLTISTPVILSTHSPLDGNCSSDSDTTLHDTKNDLESSNSNSLAQTSVTNFENSAQDHYLAYSVPSECSNQTCLIEPESIDSMEISDDNESTISSKDISPTSGGVENELNIVGQNLYDPQVQEMLMSIEKDMSAELEPALEYTELTEMLQEIETGEGNPLSLICSIEKLSEEELNYHLDTH